MGARESGPMPSTNVAHEAQVKAENFQNVLQFYIISAQSVLPNRSNQSISNSDKLTNGS